MKQHCTRKRRIARTVLLILALPLLLLTGYVSTWIAVSKSARENFISQSTALTLRPAFAPLIRYCESEFPGGAALNRFWWRITPRKVVHLGNSWIEDATPALALAPSDVPRRAATGNPRNYPQPLALPQPVSHDASAMRR